MFKNIKGSGHIPYWRQDNRHISPDPHHFIQKTLWIINMFYRVRTQNSIELLIFERQLVYVVNYPKIRQIRMLNDIYIAPTAVSLATANIQVPLISSNYHFF